MLVIIIKLTNESGGNNTTNEFYIWSIYRFLSPDCGCKLTEQGIQIGQSQDYKGKVLGWAKRANKRGGTGHKQGAVGGTNRGAARGTNRALKRAKLLTYADA